MASISIETKKISELDVASEASGDDLLLLHRADGTGTKAVKASVLKEFAQEPDYNNAGAHNSLFRGKNLGTSVTDAQWAAIKAGTFDDLWIGDYWVINNVTWRIAAFDYYYGSGDTACANHHVVLVPDTALYTAQMNSTATTDGGYAGSAMYKSNLGSAKSTINTAFSGHVLTHRKLLCTGTSSGKPAGFAWFDCAVDLLSEIMVFGTTVWGSHEGNGYSASGEPRQLPLFALNNSSGIRASYWLKDICNATTFASVGADGMAINGTASTSGGVRPAFCIY